MGNQPSNHLPQIPPDSHLNPPFQQKIIQTNPQQKWAQSSKTIEDLKELITSDPQWPQIIRSFLKSIKSKHHYQQYLRTILEQILQISCTAKNNSDEYLVLQNDSLEQLKFLFREEKLIKQHPNQALQNRAKSENKNKKYDQKQLLQLFSFYKTRLEQSYFVISQENGGVREHSDEVEFQTLLKELDSVQKNAQSYNQSHFPSMIASLMAQKLYQYSSVSQNYMSEFFMELNLNAYDSLQEFAHLLVEEFIIVQDEFNLAKFIVEKDVMMKSVGYVETCAKILEDSERKNVFDKIKQLKQNPNFHFMGMCKTFLKYKNVQAAQLIISTMILKGYHLNENQLNFYFYLELYHTFLYTINYTQKQYLEYLSKQKNQQIKTKNCTFINFIDEFQTLEIETIFDMFLSVRSYNQIQYLKKSFQKVYSLYEPKKGQNLFLNYLKNYVLGPRAHFIITIEALKNHLTSLDQTLKKDIEISFLTKLSLQINTEIIDYERHVIELMNAFNFSKHAYEFIKIIFKVSCILNKFQISLKVSDLCQFLFYNKKHAQFLKFQPLILGESFSHGFSTQQLQFQSLIIMKKVINRYFTLSQSKQEVVFIIEDKFDDECFEYSTKEIESLFIMTEYLHKSMLETFIPLQQLHQLLFQHMLHFYKYDEVQEMLKEENLNRYLIQEEVVKMLILENVRQMLVKSDKNVSLISQDIKKQFKIVEKIISNQNEGKEKDTQQVNSLIEGAEVEQLESIQSLFRLMVRLDFYSISLSQEQKENVNISLLYFLISHYEHQIQVFDYDELYRLILMVQAKHLEIPQSQNSINQQDFKSESFSKTSVHVTNEYLKFKIDLAHLAYEKGKIKFGQQILKQVLQYEPPWISSEIIKIIQKSPHSPAINHSFLNIAFQYCVKGEDLVFLLQVWKQKINQRNKKSGQKITELFLSTKNYIIVDDSYIKDQKQYRNLVAEMTFNDETLKSKDFELFFSLLGTEPQRAFYMILSKGLDLVKIEILLKQGMKLGIFDCINTTKIFFKLLYFMVSDLKQKNQVPKSHKISFLKFKGISIEEVVQKIEAEKFFDDKEKGKPYQKQIPFIFLKKLHKSVKSLLILPSQFIQNYLENSSSLTQQNMGQYLYMFLYDQNYREKHLIALKDEPMGKNDIKLYRDLCSINGLNILDLIIFNLTNQLNTVEIRSFERLLEEETTQNVLQKMVTWTQNDVNLLQEILSKLTIQIFSSQMLYVILKYLREKENPLIREQVTEEHMEILESLKQIEVNTEFHGLIAQQFFQRPICYNPKQKISEKHAKILKKQLKLRNVFLVSKIMYFCYGMSSQVEKQVLKIFIKENENEHEKQIFEQLKAKLQESSN